MEPDERLNLDATGDVDERLLAAAAGAQGDTVVAGSTDEGSTHPAGYVPEVESRFVAEQAGPAVRRRADGGGR